MKSWSGTLIGLVGTVAALVAWWQTRDPTQWLSVAGFACLTIVFSQVRLSFTAPLGQVFSTEQPLGRGLVALNWIGIGLISLGVLLRWLA